MSDLIERQAAIDALAKFVPYAICDESTESYTNGLTDAYNLICQLPSAQPKTDWNEIMVICDNCGHAVHAKRENCKVSAQSWIPVSERLPENLEEVNVTWVNRDPEPYYDFIKDKPATASAVYYKGEWYWYSSVCGDILAEYGKNDTDKVDDAIEITAWQPLPEPYQEESV